MTMQTRNCLGDFASAGNFTRHKYLKPAIKCFFSVQSLTEIILQIKDKYRQQIFTIWQHKFETCKAKNIHKVAIFFLSKIKLLIWSFVKYLLKHCIRGNRLQMQIIASEEEKIKWTLFLASQTSSNSTTLFSGIWCIHQLSQNKV